MSVNLHLAVVVRNYRPDQMEAIESAVREVLVEEEIDEDLPPLTVAEDADGRCLYTRSDPEYPVIISGAYDWAQRVEQKLRDAATQANGGPCQVQFKWDDADAGREEIEVYDD